MSKSDDFFKALLTQVFETGVFAAQPQRAIELAWHEQLLPWLDQLAPERERVWVFGAGKASASMAKALEVNKSLLELNLSSNQIQISMKKLLYKWDKYKLGRRLHYLQKRLVRAESNGYDDKIANYKRLIKDVQEKLKHVKE